MLSPNRQNKLFLIIKELNNTNIFTNVQSDDFDSHFINVFMTLKIKDIVGSKPLSFVKPIRYIKDIIRRCHKKHNVEFNFLVQPERTYYRTAKVPGLPAEKMFDGYNGRTIKIEVRI